MATVDGASDRGAAMRTISQLADRERISKQAVSKKVKQLVGLGLRVQFDKKGRIEAVDVDDYDRLRAKTDNPSKAQAPGRGPKKPKSSSAKGDSYHEALRTKTWAQSERLRLDLAVRKGELIEVSALTDAIGKCAAQIVTIVDRLPHAADDLAVAVAREGVHALRVDLKKLAVRMRKDIANALEAIAADAPKGEPEDQAAERS